MTGNLFDAPDPSAPSLSVQEGWFTAHCDGGSRGNPGPSGYGAVIEDPHGRIVARLGEFLGIQTNNYAEYSGLLAVLNWAIEKGAKRLRVVSDSELMVKQMKGQYKVASLVLRPLYEEARRRSRQLERFEMRHTLRGGNKEADRLANAAMDKGMGKEASQRVSESASQPATEEKSGSQLSGKPAPKPALRQIHPAPAKVNRQILEGYVKGGVVHLLEGELPEGIFVKIIRE